MQKQPCVYMLASRMNGTLYIGVTSNLPQLIAQHKSGEVAGFARKHGVSRMVWFEPHETMQGAITREKQMKKWKRAWKIQEIIRGNPDWRDLSDHLG